MFKIKNILLLIIIISTYLNIIHCRVNLIDDVLDNYDLKYEEHLKSFFLDYLDTNNLLESEQLITENDIKKIIVDIMLEGISPNEIDENIITMYKELSNIYTEKILKEKKEIKGKDLKDIINIKDLMQKYYELNGESPIYDDDYIFDDNNINLEYNDFDL